MKSRVFGRSGKLVSEIGLGCWQLGGRDWRPMSEKEGLRILAAAAETGVTFFDTADMYGAGRSETLIGAFLNRRPDRDRFFVATKVGRWAEPGWPENFSRAVVRKHVEASLRRLAVERLDLVQTHSVPIDVLERSELLTTLREFQAQGVIGAIGASVETMAEAERALQLEGISSLQIIFNLLRQAPARTVLPEAHKRGVAVVARVPLASGLLSGSWGIDKRFDRDDHRHYNEGGRSFYAGETFAGLKLDCGLKLVRELRRYLPADRPMSEQALRWCLDFPEISTVIPGAGTPGQVVENARASLAAPHSEQTHRRLWSFYETKVEPVVTGEI